MSSNDLTSTFLGWITSDVKGQGQHCSWNLTDSTRSYLRDDCEIRKQYFPTVSKTEPLEEHDSSRDFVLSSALYDSPEAVAAATRPAGLVA